MNVPRAVAVETDVDGLPVAISRHDKRKRVQTINEIWRIDDEWWRDRIARRYVETILDGGERVVMYEDETTGEWYEQR